MDGVDTGQSAKRAERQTNQQVADALFRSVHTVTGHVTNILSKLDLSSRTAALAIPAGFTWPFTSPLARVCAVLWPRPHLPSCGQQRG